MGLEVVHRLGIRRTLEKRNTTVMGLEFSNPVGFSAGFDKNGRHVDALMALGFHFIAIGTITPRPQPGNPRPRLFRIPEAQALVNRMGFNNDGVDVLISNLGQTNYSGVIGISIGKNATTPLQMAADDYLAGLRRVYQHAGYVALNISSPGTKHLQRLREPAYLTHLLRILKSQTGR